MNTLYYGDNLEILRRYIPDETVDLIYLDPPFNSKATYNMLFEEHDGSKAASQFQAFEDTWHWDHTAVSLPTAANVFISSFYTRIIGYSSALRRS